MFLLILINKLTKSLGELMSKTLFSLFILFSIIFTSIGISYAESTIGGDREVQEFIASLQYYLPGVYAWIRSRPYMTVRRFHRLLGFAPGEFPPTYQRIGSTFKVIYPVRDLLTYMRRREEEYRKLYNLYQSTGNPSYAEAAENIYVTLNDASYFFSNELKGNFFTTWDGSPYNSQSLVDNTNLNRTNLYDTANIDPNTMTLSQIRKTRDISFQALQSAAYNGEAPYQLQHLQKEYQYWDTIYRKAVEFGSGYAGQMSGNASPDFSPQDIDFSGGYVMDYPQENRNSTSTQPIDRTLSSNINWSSPIDEFRDFVRSSNQSSDSDDPGPVSIAAERPRY